MPAAARRPLLRSLPMAVAILALLLPAAPALAQALLSARVVQVNGKDVSVQPWEGVEVAEGGSVKLTFTADPAPENEENEFSIPLTYISHLNGSSGLNSTLRRTSIARFNSQTINLNTQDFGPVADLYADNSTYEGNRMFIVRVSRQSPHSKVYEDNSSGTRDLIITVTDEEDAHDPDVNASGSVDASDALILYYAYSLRNDLGTGR